MIEKQIVRRVSVRSNSGPTSFYLINAIHISKKSNADHS